MLGVTLLIAEGAAGAYDQKVHVYLSQRAYGGPKTVAADPTQATAVAALRERVWHAGAEAKDPELKRRFLARYPTLAAFDTWSWKRFLGLNVDQTVAGLDDTPLPGGTDGAAVYALASRLVDDDGRNRERLRHDDARKVVIGPYKEPLPEDPATLEMGALTGLSSQAHAHYQLPLLTFSDDPAVLKKDPRRFAVPPTVHTFGAEYAELYTELAMLAQRLPAGERVMLTHAGASAHHIEDVANQIHAVQVGVYDFFVDAKIESLKEELRSVGGLLRSRPSFVTIGINIIKNHHTLTEALYEKHLLTPGDPVAKLSASTPIDPAFNSDLAKIRGGCEPGFARAIVMALADRSSVEGPEVYARVRAVADRRYSRVGEEFDGDPDAALRPNADLTAFYALEAAGARRSDLALDGWWRRFNACAEAGPEVEARFAEALVRDRLNALDAMEARQKAWTPKPPDHEQINYWVPVGYLVALSLAVWLARTIARRRARRAGRA